MIESPATDEQVAAVEDALGVDLPDDLRTWWQLANGMRESLRRPAILPLDYHPFSTGEALTRRGQLLEIGARFVDAATVAHHDAQPAGTSGSGTWLPRWLPIAGSSGSDTLFVDLRHGPAHGCIREYSPDFGPKTPAFDSVAAMLSAYTRKWLWQDFRSGRSLVGCGVVSA